MRMRIFWHRQVEQIVQRAHRDGKRLRVVGSALSPNGLGLSEDTMISLAQCDRVKRINWRTKTVTVEVRPWSTPRAGMTERSTRHAVRSRPPLEKG